MENFTIIFTLVGVIGHCDLAPDDDLIFFFTKRRATTIIPIVRTNRIAPKAIRADRCISDDASLNSFAIRLESV
jgi:hypothetical protein